MKAKWMTAFLRVALVVSTAVAISGVVLAQNLGQDSGQNSTQYESPDLNAKPSPSVPMPSQSDSPMDESSASRTSVDGTSTDRSTASANQGVMAQEADDQDAITPQPSGQNSMNQNSPNQGSISQGQSNQGPMDPGLSSGSNNNDNGGSPSYSTPAPDEKNGVARISLIHGDVSTQRGDTGSWSAAALNAPVLAGDRVSTGDKARTEIQLDYANMLRLAEHSQANITQLTHSQIQIQLGHGMANYSEFANSDALAEIDTPNVAIKTEGREASFRILVTADDHTEVLVRKGEIEVTTPQGGTRVAEGQYITVQGTGADEQYKVADAPVRDDFDQWNTDRDGMIRNSISRRNTNGYYQGSEDLDNKGTWSQEPDYGQVWRPNEPSGWAPYRDGRWVYEPYWGWTWVSADDWGWAPYHYGRWMYLDSGWAWWPGPVYGSPFYRPIWAPAYVSFFGFGGFGLGFGFGFGGWGSVGWLPLGPCDHFHPWYGRYGGRYGTVGLAGYNRGGFAPLHGGSRFSNVDRAMHDEHFRGATSTSGREFGTGHMTARAMSHGELQNAHFATGRMPVSPGRESFSASGRPAAASTTHGASENRHFFSSRGTSAAAGTASGLRSGNNSTSRSEGRSFQSRTFEGRPLEGRSSEGRSSAGRTFDGRSASDGRALDGRSNGGFERSNQNTGGRESASNGGWQKFSPMSQRSAAAESARSESSARGQTGRGDERGAYGSSRGSASESRGFSSGGYGPQGRGYSGSSSRPPLNMRQPIVTQRSYGGNNGGRPHGGSPYGGASGRSGSYGGRLAPSYGGGHSAPSYGSRAGGAHSSPSHGGGSYHGGGSSHGGGGRHGR